MAQQYTKNKIRETFIALLNQKSLDHITVTELARQCQIERKTFYYHYENIYQLILEILDDDIARIISEYYEDLQWQEVFFMGIKFITENKRAIDNMYRSIYKEDLEKYIYNVSGKIMDSYIRSLNMSASINPKDIEIIITFFQCAIYGSITGWVKNGITAISKNEIDRLGRLVNLMLDACLKNYHPNM